jgi:hypothetical protein
VIYNKGKALSGAVERGKKSSPEEGMETGHIRLTEIGC